MKDAEINNILELSYADLQRSKEEFHGIWLLPDYTSMKHWLRGYCVEGGKKLFNSLVCNLARFLQERP